MLVKKRTKEFKEFFELEGFKVIIHKESYEAQPHSEAIIKVRVGDKTELAAAEGTGPVNALDCALRKALERFYPQLSQIKLTDYKVRVLDSKSATAAKVRVLIETQNGTASWNTVGVSPDVIEASWKALVDSLSFHLLKSEKRLIKRTALSFFEIQHQETKSSMIIVMKPGATKAEFNHVIEKIKEYGFQPIRLLGPSERLSDVSAMSGAKLNCNPLKLRPV